MSRIRLFAYAALVLTMGVLAACASATPTASDVDASTDNGALATVSVKSLRVRAEPDSDAEVVTGIKEGEQYKVIGLSSDGEWVQLAVPRAPTGRGWVSTNYVTVQGAITDAGVTQVDTKPATLPQTVTPQVTTPQAGEAAINTEGARLRVRAEPTTDAEIVGYVYNGESYPVVETSGDGTWVKIGGKADTDNPDGGWVSAEFLVIGQ